jgi:hypothetical protein
MLMAPLYYHEMVEIHHTQKKVKKKLVKSWILISKILDKVYNNLKDWIKFFFK